MKVGFLLAKRFAALLIVLVLGIMPLSGCSAFRGGQSADHANSVTVLPEGVEKIKVYYRSGLDGFTRNYYVQVELTVADGFLVADESALLEWGLRWGWSINDHDLTSVTLQVFTNPGDPFDWKDEEAFRRLNLDPTRVIYRDFPPPSVGVSVFRLEPLFGEWPGEVPETPSGLFVRAP